MTASASDIFGFLEQSDVFVFDRREIAMPVFNRLRRNVRRMYLQLADTEDAESIEISDKLRMYMSEWLTVPVPLDSSIAESLATIGDLHDVRLRWGDDISRSYEQALAAAREISEQPNPLRIELKNAIEKMCSEGDSFRIYCHRRARIHFETLIEAPSPALVDDCFLHSVQDYRDAPVFDTLIKVGPLRSYGWSSAPDALIAAPRFGQLTQFVWSGCADERGFGYDPVAPSVTTGETAKVSEAKTRSAIKWKSQLSKIGEADPSDELGQIEDELELFARSVVRADRRPAVLIQVDNEHGVLYPAHAEVLSFDPTEGLVEPIAERRVGTELVAGMFCILPRLGEVDLGELHAGEGQFSGRWKERLRHELANNADGIYTMLRSGGITLVHLRSRMANWARPPTTVIHAPQNSHDFEILINVLGIDFDPHDPRRHKGIPWWRYAWRDIQRARGEAIQTGLQEHEIINQELEGFLNNSLTQIRENAGRVGTFQVPIIAGREVYGDFLFFKIVTIEDGFFAPDSELKCVRELAVIEQWRV